MSKRIPPRPAQRKSKAQPPMSERLAGGDPWDKETKPDEDYRLLAKRPGMQMDDYVDFPSRAVAQEGEAVPENEQTEISRESANRFDVMRAEEIRKREAARYGSQVKDMLLRSISVGVDLPDERKALDALLEAGNSKLKRAA